MKQMTYKKVNLTHEHEQRVAEYCAVNNKEFNQATAYDLTMLAFKDNPVLIKETDPNGEETKTVDVTHRVARQIEYMPRTVDRIADKIIVAKERVKKEQWAKNIELAKSESVPDLDKLVENLYRLNIVKGNGYLALVCFLMQLKYQRENEVAEDEKTCVFFHGEMHNGKSATAKAICEYESQYGEVYRVKSGKQLESTHEEMVWQSHLNYFNEVKPTDIDKDTLSNLVDGGHLPLNPKNKPSYIQYVRTNNMFTSNHRIALQQRRVSVIKFGDRLNGRPLESGALKKVIANIMNSLPSFDHYYDICEVVSKVNTARIDPFAIENIITFLTTKLPNVKHCHPNTLETTAIFAPHDIYNCVKSTFGKAGVPSDRKENILAALHDFADSGLIDKVVYTGCTTEYFRVNGHNYIKIMGQFDKTNTTGEEKIKITRENLRDLLRPYFITHDGDGGGKPDDIKTADTDESKNPPTVNGESEPAEWTQELLAPTAPQILYDIIEDTPPPVPADVRQKGAWLSAKIVEEKENITAANKDEMLQALMTPEACQFIGLSEFVRILESHYDKDTITDLYVLHTGLSDPDVRQQVDWEKYHDCCDTTGIWYREKSPWVEAREDSGWASYRNDGVFHLRTPPPQCAMPKKPKPKEKRAKSKSAKQ
jgi:hypothetical protein